MSRSYRKPYVVDDCGKKFGKKFANHKVRHQDNVGLHPVIVNVA